MAEAVGIESMADRTDAAIHHVGGRDDVRAGLRLDKALQDELLDAGVVDDFIANDDAVVAVACVRIERYVGDDANVRNVKVDRAGRSVDQIFRVERLRAGLVAQVN